MVGEISMSCAEAEEKHNINAVVTTKSLISFNRNVIVLIPYPYPKMVLVGPLMSITLSEGQIALQKVK